MVCLPARLEVEIKGDNLKQAAQEPGSRLSIELQSLGFKFLVPLALMELPLELLKTCML